VTKKFYKAPKLYWKWICRWQ